MERNLFKKTTDDDHTGRNATKKKSRDSSEKLSAKMSAFFITMKVTVFIICLGFFFYQSTGFLNQYYAYPTTTTVEITNPLLFKTPAITICNDNPVRLSVFCEVFKVYCQKPDNITLFCEKNPNLCGDSAPELLIPQLGYFSEDNNRVLKIFLRRFYFENRFDEKTFKKWTWDMHKSSKKMQMVFVRDFERFVYITCYSANLHLSDDIDPDLWNLHKSKPEYFREDATDFFYIAVENEEAFFTWTKPQLYLAVHSPFVPTNPIYDGQPLKTGYMYSVNIRLEEEHLLPEPYQTNCTDYDALWRKNNKTGPRSQEVCNDECEQEAYDDCVPLNTKVLMMEFSKRRCLGYHSTDMYPEKYEKYQKCKKNCRPSCIKLKYSYSLSERLFENSQDSFWETGLASNLTLVQMFVFKPEVIVMKQVPVYDNEAIFSNVGGLMGCWLGISVWAFAGITQTAFLTTVQILFPMLCRSLERCTRAITFSKTLKLRRTTVRNY